MNRITLLKKVDALIGGIAVAALPAARGAAPRSPRRILVIRPGGIGDAVLIVPPLQALKRRFPEAELSVLAERRNAAVFSLCPAVDRLLLYDRPAQLFRVLRGGYDVVIDSEQWHRLSAVIARLSRAPLSVGFASNDRSRLFSHGIGYSHDHYEADSFFSLLAPLAIDPPATLPVPFLTLPDAAARRADALLTPLNGRSFLAVFPGASIAERRWGASRFGAVAERLAGRGLAVVVVGGGEDVAEGEAIVAGCGGLNLAGKTSLAETAAVLARAALLLSGDSGVLHLAVGLDVPTVALFGPGIEAKWGPKGARHLVLNRKLPCSPCTRFGTTPPCPIAARCMTDITVDEVAGAVEVLLRRTGR